MKKILILIGGIVCFVEDEFWRRLAAESGFKIDFAFSLWADHKFETNQWIKERTISTDFENQIDVADFYKEVFSQGVIHPDETRPLNSLFMWHKWSRFLLFDGLDNYDVIIKTRSDIDIGRNDLRPVTTVIGKILSSDPLYLAIPSGGDHRGGMHDIIAIGRPLAMRHYLSIIKLISTYYDQLQLFHPERMLRYHLIDCGKMRILRFPFSIMLRNSAYNDDNIRSYTDCLPLCPCKLRTIYEKVKKKGLQDVLRTGLGSAAGILNNIAFYCNRK